MDLFTWAAAHVDSDEPNVAIDAALPEAPTRTAAEPAAPRPTRIRPKQSSPTLPDILSTPRTAVSCETIAEGLRAIEASGSLSPKALADLRSAVKSFSRAVRRAAEDLPLAPPDLVPLLRKVAPPAHDMSAKRWKNICSGIARIGRFTGHIVDAPSAHMFRNAAWPRLLDAFDNEPWKSMLRRFAGFCDREDIDPSVVDAKVLERYRRWLAANTYGVNGAETVKNIRGVWNRHFLPRHPQVLQAIATPVDPRRQVLPPTAFPESFTADLDAYVARLKSPDPFDPRRGRRLAPLTIDERRRFLLRGASILVQEGMPAAQITGLACLANAGAMRTVLLAMLRRAGGRWTSNAEQMAVYIRAVAWQWVRLAEDAMKPLCDLSAMVRVDHKGLGSRSRQRLVAFDNPQTLRKLFELPGDLMDAAEKLLADEPTRAAHLYERGLALQLMLVLPMRRRNLEALDLVRHFERDASGRCLRLVIPASEVKNGIELSADMPAALAARLRRHLTVFRRHLPGAAESSWLFPSSNGGPRAMGSLVRILAREVRNATGAEFHCHMFRHIAASLLYDEDPANGPVVQRLLAHTQLKTTETVYGVMKTRGAQRRWGETLDRKLARIERNTKRGRS